MKGLYIALALAFVLNSGFAQDSPGRIIATDVANFWAAYDKIVTVKDSAEQYAYLNQLFLNRGTDGLKAIMRVRNYTAKSYIDAINDHPLFWKSIRANTLKAGSYAKSIEANILKLKKLYPQLKPSNIYFTIGAFRTGGTTLSNMVLIGSEIAMADEHTNTQEFPPNFDNLRTFFKTNPLNILVFTNVHEYVHTQQKTTVANTLLGQCLLEGVAEFMAEKATGKQTTLPAISYGKSHEARVKDVFASQMFNADEGFWLYSNAVNEFKQRDMGYYVGYAICSAYYNKASNKTQAVKAMIELDYNNESALAALVDQSGYFNKPVQALRQDYDKRRPVVLTIKPFKNNSAGIDTAIHQITIEFSEPMSKRSRNFELGPLGMNNLMRVKRFVGFSEDGKQATIEVDLKPKQHYQLLIGDRFTSITGLPLKPYLIDFSTL